MRNLIIACILTITVVSCKEKKTEKAVTYNEVTAEDRFALTLPDYLKETNNLNESASLQYENGSKEVYIIVVDESKEGLAPVTGDTLLEKYFKTTTNGFISSLKNSNIENVKSRKINDLPAVSGELKGKLNEHDVFYIIATVESPTHFYQVITWTLESNKALYIEDMERMVNSFKELNE